MPTVPRQVGSGRMKEKIKQITGPNRAANPNCISRQILTVLQAHETISLHILSRSYLICVVIKSHTVMDLRVQGNEAGCSVEASESFSRTLPWMLVMVPASYELN